MVPVCSGNVVTYPLEDSSLPYLGPVLQVPGPIALVEVVDQVYETVLRKEVRHLLAPRDPRVVKVDVQVPDDNGVPEALRGLLWFGLVLQRRQREVRANEWVPV